MKILFLQKRLLFPSNTGGKIRTLNVLRHLAVWHDITYVCNLLDEETPYLPKMRALGVQIKTVPWREPSRRSLRFLGSAVANLFSSRPLNVDKDFDSRLRNLVENELDGGGFDLLICDFVQMARNCLGLKLPKLLFQHNVEAEVFERLAARKQGLFARYLSMQGNRMRRFEAQAGLDFDGVVAVSRKDKTWFENEYHWPQVEAIDTAVDTDYFSPTEGRSREGVVFVGSMDWPPNVDGIHHFIDRIWPTVRATRSDAELTIVGRNPPESIRQFHGKEGIFVTGTVDDIRPYLNAAAVGIVPLYSGGGTRLKIFEYMAMKVPLISTALGAEGLPIRDGEHLIIRDDDHHFSEQLIELLNNENRRQELSRKAFGLVHERYSSTIIARQFERCCEQAVINWEHAKL